ncbi:adenosylcobinamide-GDP ribazoletransferase [Anaerovorax sp. IOR16]|uniref:adenosylcobinamide-GDP ribazoletransferase n=1 Tax=Anaerovorax sp. IOR16 TaxID=2773458 RepID=UPI0019D0683B|nr:adenosylcobinamide-GDP ribazoletransferase [Anaerovorax sp. IOR16]
MKTIWLMMAFFTRLPVPYVEYTEERYLKGLELIPLLGILMGGILYGLSFFHLIFDPQVVSMILLGGYIVLTGGLHLDGLADTCDGIFSGRERDRMLEIMKDSHVGSFGVLSMIFFVAFYMVMYGRIPYESLLVLPVVGKSAPLISASFAEYVRPSGMGKLLVDNCGKVELFMAIFVPTVVAALLNPWYLIAVGVAIVSVILSTNHLKKVLGGITGDTMGMVCELSQMVFVFVIYATQSFLS